MSTRTVLLIFIPVAALLIVALLWSGADDISMSGSAAVRPLTAAPRDGLLPSAGLTLVADEARAAEPLPDFTPAELVDLTPAPAAAAHMGSVTGVLVDAAGKAVAGEPVLLLLERDPWEPRLDRRDDPERPRQLMGTTVSDGDGRFALAARAGVRHALLAGGASWARAVVPAVVSGDELRVVLSEGLVLEGTVLDAATTAPVAAAFVLAASAEDQLMGRTDSDGRYRLGPLPDANLLVGAWAPGFDIVLQGNVSPVLGPLELALPAGREIAGRVLDRETQLPVSTGGELTLTVDVMARLAGGEALASLPQVVQVLTATLDEKGGFRFPPGPSIGFDILTRAPGYVPDRYDRAETRPVGADDQVIIALRPLVPRAGRVILGENGGPVPGATVTAAGPAGEFCRTQSGADGSFLLDAATWDGEGPVYVEAADSTGTLGARVRLDRDDDALLLQLVPRLTLQVQVQRSGTPVPGAEVALLSRRATPTVGRSGAEGLVTLTHTLAGPAAEELRVQARHDSRESLPLVLDLTAPLPPAPLVLDLDSGLFVSGRVTSPDGTALPSAAVSFRPAAQPGTPAESGGNPRDRSNRGNSGGDDDEGGAPGATLYGHADAEGRFRLGPLAAETTGTLLASARDFRERSWEHVLAGTGDLELVLEPVVRWTGRVLDASTGMPFKDAGITLQREAREDGKVVFHNVQQPVERTPGAPGDFAVTLPDRGRYVVRAAAQNYLSAVSAPVDFNGVHAPPFVTLVLAPAAVLEVTVLDGRGRPVVGYTVAAITWDKGGAAQLPAGDVRKGARTARTDGQGRARLQLGEGGTYRIAGGPGLWFDAQQVLVTPGPPVQRTYTLPPTGELEVTVNDEQGRPLVGVRVEVRSSRSEQSHAVTRQTSAQDGDGKVLIEGLPPGDYDVTLRRRNFDTGRLSVLIKSSQLERRTVGLQPRTP